VVIWYILWIFGIFFPVFVYCTKKNLATLGCATRLVHRIARFSLVQSTKTEKIRQNIPKGHDMKIYMKSTIWQTRLCMIFRILWPNRDAIMLGKRSSIDFFWFGTKVVKIIEKLVKFAEYWSKF
jgi:hypothetical protein